MTSSTPALDDARATFESFLAARRLKHGDLRMEADDSGTDGQNDDKDGSTDGAKPDEDTRTDSEKLAALAADFEALKANSRKWEDRAKANKAAADKLADAEKAGMTAEQRAEAAERQAAEKAAELARYKVAHETGLPAALLSLLNGDEDQMREQATALIAFKGEAPKSTAPKPDPSQGGSGGTKKRSSTDEGLAEAARRFGKK